MTALALPAPDAPFEEWGRLAVSIPVWRWLPGMLGCHHGWTMRVVERKRTGGVRFSGGGDVGPNCWPDPGDPATAGCLLALLGRPVEVRLYNDAGVTRYPRVGCLLSEGRSGHASTLGRACIAAAAALGRWPGGAK